MRSDQLGNVLTRLGSMGVVPVVAIENTQDAVPLVEALVDGGLPCAEITFRTAAAEESIRLISERFPDVLLGAGTVLTVEQAKKAVSSGVEFIVTPGFDPKVVEWCLTNQVAITPGVATPTEISMALSRDLRILKFFPAEPLGGIRTLKALSAPFVGVKFIPTGGVNAENLVDYLALEAVHACGGSWTVKKTLISEGKFAQIEKLAREAMAIVREVRG